MKITGAIFDLDGTLLDSMPVWERFGERYLLARGISAPADLGDTLKAMSLPEAAAYFRETFGFAETRERILAEFNELLAREYRERVVLKPHVQPFLHALERSGVKMCVATATDREIAEEALERLGISRYFAFVITCADAGCGKDSPAVYQMALARLGTKLKYTAVFEDALFAARTAKAAGFPVVGVADPSAGVDRMELARVADEIIESFGEWAVESDA